MTLDHITSARDEINRVLNKLKHLDLTGSVHYDSRYPVAQGGTGDVFKDRYTRPDGTTVDIAVKRLRTYLDSQLDVTNVFRREIKAWSRLEHPNILPLLGYTLDETGSNSLLLPSLVSEWMKNGNILEFIKSNPDCNIEIFERLILGMAEGLAYLHANYIVHSDFKSGNVLVSPHCEALISDFGAAHMSCNALSVGESSIVANVRGTYRWMAYELLNIDPEQQQAATYESDVWSFGMTLLEVLTGELPYSQFKHDGQVMLAIVQKTLPSPPTDLEKGECWSQLWEVCMSCWSWEPNRRPTMDAISQRLKTVLDRQPVVSFADVLAGYEASCIKGSTSVSSTLHSASPEISHTKVNAPPLLDSSRRLEEKKQHTFFDFLWSSLTNARFTEDKSDTRQLRLKAKDVQNSTCTMTKHNSTESFTSSKQVKMLIPNQDNLVASLSLESLESLDETVHTMLSEPLTLP